jgi:hypothetical protein
MTREPPSEEDLMTTGHSASINLLEEISAFCKTENIAESTLKAHNGLWFNDESYVISRKRD